MTSQRRIRLFLDSNVLTGGIVSQWGLDKAALSLAIAITRLLCENVRDFLRDGISFADIRDLELSRVQRLRKRHGVFCLLEVDGDLVQIGPN